MKINKERLEKTMGRAKRWLADARLTNNKDMLDMVRPKAEEACLAVAMFKCQKCGCEKNLTIHHLVPKKARFFMDKWRYFTQRYYWANMLCLCVTCHADYHKHIGLDTDKMGTIPEKKLIKLKKRYLVE